MVIPYSQSCYDHAKYEVSKRSPFMLTKYKDTKARRAGQIRGLVIEHHVASWFKHTYPDHYEEPDNYKQWTEICSHDFKIKFTFDSLLIDVSGPRKDGTFGSYKSKPKKGVDAHILCCPIGFTSWASVDYKKGFKVMGVVKSKHYIKDIKKEHIVDFGSWLKSIGL